ncbi:peptidoglycan-binding protein [bacterium]|nr:peptidoglycan-binding protein [bacterium]
MRWQIWSGLAVALCLSACAEAIPVASPTTEDLSGEAIARGPNGPPSLPVGACWGHDTIPAVIETVTQTVQDQPELRDAAGKLVRPASYNSFARQRILQDRREVYVRTPCYNQLTPDTIVTLQRALKARGYYQQPLTGELDLATMAAIRHYQADHGLDTSVLSLKAALALGLVIADRGSL